MVPHLFKFVRAPRRVQPLFLCTLLFLCMMLLTRPLHAADQIVTNVNDNGPGSLRQLIADATADDKIVFDASLSGATIVLNKTLTIDKPLTIDGSSLPTPITVSGSRAIRMLTVSSAATTTLISLVIANELTNPDFDHTFSGIANTGILVLHNVTMRGLRTTPSDYSYRGGGAAIYNEGVLVVAQSTFAGNLADYFNQFGPGYGYGGGAIYNRGAMTIEQSTFSGNFIQQAWGPMDSAVGGISIGGGAILNRGQATVTNSTFDGNRSDREGGALLHLGDGLLTIRNSTITGNSAYQGGGLYTKGDLQLSNTIIADSSGGDDCWNTGTLATNAHNLIESGNCAALVTADPNVGPLAAHGGATQTRMLIAGSPALDAGDSTLCPPVDQRGVARPLGAGCDIGAVEGAATAAAPEIEVTGNGISIAHGEVRSSEQNSTSFGEFVTPGTQATHRFTIINRGTADLTNLAVQLSPIDGGFAVAAQPTAVLAPGQSSPFDILFTAQTVGPVNVTVEISSNDSDEMPYRFMVQALPCGQTLSVTTTAALGPGSLPATLAQSCSGGVVTFAPDLSGATITLSSTLEIDRDVTIDGTALATPITLRGNGQQRILHIPAATTATLTGFTVADGYIFTPLPVFPLVNGAGLLNEGTAVVDQITFQNNQNIGGRALAEGGAISNRGMLTVTNSTFTANGAGAGGAIVNHAQLVVQKSTFVNNHVETNGGGYGGAIYNSAFLTVTNSTFHANQSAGAYAQGRGGAIFNSGTAWVTNSTFSENEITPNYLGDGTGGAIANDGILHLVNTILANSVDSTACDGLLTTNINNLIEDGSCAALFSGDPLLGPLADNGGSTLTHALLPGSLAINGADAAACPATDQRGMARPQHIACDIGAFEAEVVGTQPAWTVQGNGRSIANGSTAPTVDNGTMFALVTLAQGQRSQTFRIGNPGTVDLTDLQVTLTGAQVTEFDVTTPPPSTIAAGALADFAVTFVPAALGRRAATVIISSSTADLPTPYTFAITGYGCLDAITVQTTADEGSGSLRQALLDLCPDGVVTFAEQLSGQMIGLHSSLLITKSLTIDGSSLAVAPTLDGNQATQLLTIQEPKRVMLRNLVLAHGYFRDYQRGGAVFNEGYLTVDHGTFENNGAGTAGGAINNRGSLTVTQSAFVNNYTAYPGGGAIRHQAGSLWIDQSSFTGNSSTNNGGAIYSESVLVVTNSSFRDNLTGQAGGAIASLAGLVVTIRNSTFVDNHAATTGGGFHSAAAATIQNSTFSANSADGGGGGLYGKGTLTLNNSTINANQGGGFVSERAAHLINTIIANSVDGSDCSGPLATSINNLIADGSCGAVLTGDPLLAPLADNGGPTFTHALGFGSPAVDGGDNAHCLATDQRGVARPIDGNSDTMAICDIGAVEAPIGPYIPPTATATPTPITTPTPTMTLEPSPTASPTDTPTGTSTGTSTGTPTDTATPAAIQTPTPTATFIATTPPLPTVLWGDGNGDQIVDRADLSACVHELFDDDGNFWQDAPGGSYPGTSGCDANADTRIDAGDLSCMGLLIFGDHARCGELSVQRQEEKREPATLAIEADPRVLAGDPLSVPIRLTRNGANVTAAAFRLSFDEHRLTFDPTDRDGDRLPDAIYFALPTATTQALITVTVHSGALDIFVSSGMTTTETQPRVWEDGVFLTITLLAQMSSDSTPVTSTLAFTPIVPPSLGSSSGTSLPVQVSESSVQILPATSTLYLPLIHAP